MPCWFAKLKVRTVGRCVECDLPLALPGMGPTRESARGPVHNICIPTVVRADGPAAVREWLAASTHPPERCRSRLGGSDAV